MDAGCWPLKATSEKVSFAAAGGGEEKLTGTSGHKEALARPSSALMTSCSSERKDSKSCPSKVSQQLSTPPQLSDCSELSAGSDKAEAQCRAIHGTCGKPSENLLLNIFNAPCLGRNNLGTNLPSITFIVFLLCSQTLQESLLPIVTGLNSCINLLPFPCILPDKSFMIASSLLSVPENEVHSAASLLCLLCPSFCRMHLLSSKLYLALHTNHPGPSSSFTYFFRPYLKM